MVTRFHTASPYKLTKASFDKDSFSRLIESSAAPYLQLSAPNKLSFPLRLKIFHKSVFNYLDFQNDWTRGRFIGQVIKIVICNGMVTQKTFITPKGSIIKVDRSSLGIRYKLFNAINFMNKIFSLYHDPCI